MSTSKNTLKELARLVRYYSLVSTTTAGSGHPSSCLSATDLMTGLFFGGFFKADLDHPEYPLNDRLIFSKGHAAPLLYSLYAVAGKLKEEDLLQLRKFDSPLEGHPSMRWPFTEVATGSLGQGLSVGVGMAMNAKYVDKTDYRTFVLTGDSELAEGSIWEAAEIASHYKLNNLVAIADVSRLGQRGETLHGHRLRELKKQFKAFGWRVLKINGHSFSAITRAYTKALEEKDKPVVILAKTYKGRGVNIMENKEGWHGKPLSTEELAKALKKLGSVDKNLRKDLVKPLVSNNIQTNISSLQKAVTVKYSMGDKVATRRAYGEALAMLYTKFPEIVALDAEVSNSTYADIFKNAYPERFFEMFIAEQNMVGVALGFSRRSKIPFVSTFAAFFSRAFDQIRMSQYSNSNIKFVGSHVGVSIGEDGASQMGLEDIAMFRTLLGSVVLYPSDAQSCLKLVEQAAAHQGNVYLRTTREALPVIYGPTENFPIGGCKVLREDSADAVTVVAAGITVHEALKAYEILKEKGVKVRVVDLYSVKPLDEATLKRCAKETNNIIVVEDHYEAGGIGEAVAGVLSGERVERLCVRKMPRSGKPAELMRYEEIDAEAIVEKVKEML